MFEYGCCSWSLAFYMDEPEARELCLDFSLNFFFKFSDEILETRSFIFEPPASVLFELSVFIVSVVQARCYFSFVWPLSCDARRS